MNPYSTRTQARIQPRDMTIAALTDRHNAALSLSQLERRRGWQAEGEMAWLLRQHGIAPDSLSSRVAIVRELDHRGVDRMPLASGDAVAWPRLTGSSRSHQPPVAAPQ